jgi:hypothetical protein
VTVLFEAWILGCFRETCLISECGLIEFCFGSDVFVSRCLTVNLTAKIYSNR